MQFPTAFYACLFLAVVNAEEWTLGTTIAHDIKRVTHCEYYNESIPCADPQQCPSREECSPHEPDKRNHCYVLWNRNESTGQETIKQMGCFLDNKDCYDKSQCVERSTKRKVFQFCCCDENMCNQNYTWAPTQHSPYSDRDMDKSSIGPQIATRNETHGGCILPKQPEGGSYEVGSCKEQCNVTSGTKVPIGSFLDYKCNEGYMRKGNLVSVCYEDAWYLPPVCVKNCPPLRTSGLDSICKYRDEIVSCQSTIVPGTRATLNCKDWYNTPPDYRGYREITCLENGVWDGPVLQCIPDCGIAEAHKNGLIVNGSRVHHGGFPWHVGIYQRISFVRVDQICAGTMISPDLVISAAYCFYDEFERKLKNPRYFIVAAGKYYRDYLVTEHFAQKSEVLNIDVVGNNLNWNDNSVHSIALLHLKTAFSMSTLVRPVCIDWNNRYAKEQLLRGNSGKVVGWGKTVAGLPSNKLQEIDLRYKPYEECNLATPLKSKRYPKADTFCTNDYSRGLSLCSGDNGAGLSFKSYGRWYLRGIMSADIPEADGTCINHNYTMFINVGSYVDAIQAAYFSTGDLSEVDSSIDCPVGVSSNGGLPATISARSCILPEQPIGGRFELRSRKDQCMVLSGSRVPSGSFLIYSCNEGYTVDGNNVTVCYDGAWYPPQSCQRKLSGKNCPALTSTSVDFNCEYHGDVVSCESAMLPWTKATVTCKDFYKMSSGHDPGYREITCLEDGAWNRPVFECVPECGVAIADGTQLIVNGSTVTHSRFPWLVYIFHGSNSRCSGSLISPNLVISLAHWFFDTTLKKARDPSEYVVFVGEYLPGFNTKEPYAQQSFVKRIDIAANYIGKQENYAHNIALIHVDTPFTMTALVRPICIHWDNEVDRKELENGRLDQALEWDSLENHTIYRPVYLSREQCSSRAPKQLQHYLTADTFCGIYCSNGSSICRGNTRATVFGYESDGLWYLLGMLKGYVIDNDLSVGPLVYTNVRPYWNWILAAHDNEG